MILVEPTNSLLMCADVFRFCNCVLNHQAHPLQSCYILNLNKVCGMWKTKFEHCICIEVCQCSAFSRPVHRWQQHAIKWKWCLCSYHMVLIHFSQHCSRTHCAILVLLSAALTGEKAKIVRGARERTCWVFSLLIRKLCCGYGLLFITISSLPDFGRNFVPFLKYY
jgi:hypothetical protein